MKSIQRFVVISLGSLFVFTLFVSVANAIPAWSRKYQTDCTVCHYPNPPRLNTFGHEFRRAGFRMQDEFNKEVDLGKVQDYFSLRMRPRLVYFNPDIETATTKEDFEFQFNDITVFYAGPIASHVSAFSEIEFEDEEETTLLGQVSGMWGDLDGYFTVRSGQAHVLSRVGWGGFDRPTGISTTTVQADTLTDGGVPFRINRDQRFIEATYVKGWNRFIFQVSNGIDPSGFGNHGRNFDFDNDKDFSIVYERILDDTASGFTGYTYYGTWHDGIIPDDYHFYRLGLTGNKVFSNGFEIQGGYIFAKDELPSIKGPDIDGYGLWLDVEKYFGGPAFTVFGRIDYIDGNTDIENNSRRNYTLGFTKDVVRNTRLAIEAQAINKQAADTTDFRLTGEVMVNF